MIAEKISGDNGMKKSILLAVDGSSGGGKALRHVLATIDPDTVGIVLAYVIEWSPYSFNTPEENAERHKRRESEISRAKAGVVAPAKAELEAKGFNVSALPPPELPSTARRMDFFIPFSPEILSQSAGPTVRRAALRLSGSATSGRAREQAAKDKRKRNATGGRLTAPHRMSER